MGALLKWMIGFLLATGLATLALYDNGTVSLVWFDWVIETSLTFALAVLIVGFGVGTLLLQGGLWLVHLPRNWRRHRQMTRYAKAEKRLSQGLVAQETGDWHQAEKHLIATAKYSDNGVMHYLSAAKMAHNQGAIARQKHYLQQAKAHYPDQSVTIGLVEARLLAKTNVKQALKILAHLHQSDPTHRAVLADYAQLLAQAQLWSLLAPILPKVKQAKALSAQQWQRLQARYLTGRLETATDLNELDQVWAQCQRKHQHTPMILAAYVVRKRTLAPESEVDDLATKISQALRKHWDESLVYLYGRLPHEAPLAALKQAEKWQAKHPDTPILLLTLGRLACASQLWGQGRTFLQASLRLQPEVETFHALAQCYEAEGMDHKAALTYKEAIVQLEKDDPSVIASDPVH